MSVSPRVLQHCEELTQQYNRNESSVWVADSRPLPPQTMSSHVGKAVEDRMRAIFGVLLNLTKVKGASMFPWRWTPACLLSVACFLRFP